MAGTAEVAKRYFAAIAAHDLDAATACWAIGAVDRLVGTEEHIAPDGVREYFEEVFAAFPDFTLEVVELTTNRSRAAVRWRAHGTFAGPGSFRGFLPNGARMTMEGCDVVSVAHDLIQHNEVYADSADVARQLRLLPPAGSRTERRLTTLANARTQLLARINGVEPERVADGVWVARGGFPLRIMNVYLIEDGDGVTVFDAGIEAMGGSLRALCARFGGTERVVLGHADPDHRGAAPSLLAPVFCHPAERPAAESVRPWRDYWDMQKLDFHGRLLLSRLVETWDGGPVAIEGTVADGDEVAGFRVVELPGHAPGLIGLWRESDRLALASDCLYTIDIQTGLRRPPSVPHPAFDADIEQARASMRRLAELEPRAVWTGHGRPVTGDVGSQLRAAADA
jgi:glyoxylase-like metal-dependent hydrolase (beta-lactamase superfamily II)/predicted ester cyclase